MVMFKAYGKVFTHPRVGNQPCAFEALDYVCDDYYDENNMKDHCKHCPLNGTFEDGFHKCGVSHYQIGSFNPNTGDILTAEDLDKHVKKLCIIMGWEVLSK